jgi:Fic family protein
MEAVDRGESTSAMEPLLIPDGSRHRAALNDLAFDLTRKSSGFRRSLPRPVQAPLANLVRAMNCYYSNLIEGHDTHPIDIERALRDDYSQDRKKRDLQIEAKAHMAVQQWIDHGGLSMNQAVTPHCLHRPGGLHGEPRPTRSPAGARSRLG